MRHACVCLCGSSPKTAQDGFKTAQDGSKTVPRGLLGGSGAALGGFGALFGRSWCSCWIILGLFWGLWGVRFVDSIHRFDSMMRFVDSIRFDSLIRFVASSWSHFGSFWVVWNRFGAVLDRFGVRFVDSIHRSDSMMRFVVSIR